MTITNLQALIGVAVLVASALVLTRMKQGDIKIERAGPGADITGKSKHLGASLAADICPVCGESGFYHGGGGEIFCGNPNCRAGFEITNLGPGEVWAKQIERGADRLYSAKPLKTAAANNNNKSLLSRVWTRRRKA